MALHLISAEDLRVACRQRLESCELWLRRLVDDELSAEFGANYVQDADLNGNKLFGTSVQAHVQSRRQSTNAGTIRDVDTLLLDQLATVICKDDAYKKFFSTALSYGFPKGKEHLRLMFQRLVPIRNALSHANPISDHEAERVLCYCSDIISSLTEHYAALGMTHDFDAPSFTRYSDSLGNSEQPSKSDVQLNFTKNDPLRCGESLRMEVEVDSHYPPDSYDILWQVVNIPNGERASGTGFALTLDEKHVGESFCVFVSVISNKNTWHRHGRHDARIVLVYRVLPPIS